MLIHRSPSFKSAAHAHDVGKAVLNEKRRRAQTAVTVVTINHDVFVLVRLLHELLYVAVIQMDRSRNMRLPVRAGIANIDEQAPFLIESLFRFANLNLGNFHNALFNPTMSFYQARAILSTA